MRTSHTAETCLALEFSLDFQLALTLFNLIVHEVIDPEAHLDVVLEHHHNHAVESESEIVLLNRKLLKFFFQSSQLNVAFRYDLKRSDTGVVLLCHGREARLSYDFELLVKGFDHFFDVVGAPKHERVSQEASTFKQDLFIHFLVFINLLLFFLRLAELGVNFVLLFFTQRQLFIDVGLERVIGNLDFILALLVLLVVLPHVLVDALGQ